MSLFGDVLGTGLGGVGGGLLAHYWGDLTSTPPNGPGAPQNKKPMTAADVKMPQDLTDALSGIGARGTAGINDIYGQAKQRRAGENQTLGMAPGSDSYGAERFPVSQNLSQGGLESALGGVLGNTGYQNTLAERDYGQQRQLAEEAAALNKPSLLEEILQGIGGAGKTAATYYGMQNRGPSQYASGSGPGTSYDIMRPGPLDLGYGGF